MDLYADETQLYIVFNQDDGSDIIKRIEVCALEKKVWMAMHWLKLNDEKTLWLLLQTSSLSRP